MEITTALERLSALAQETRLTIFRKLVEQGPGGLAAGELAEKIGISPSNLSFHVAALERAGLVAGAKSGRSIAYTADYRAMSELLAYLYENCCQGGGCAPAAKPAGRATKGKR
jgi:ArsR family transcriptional regulator, arsenate/arsenite/antimonite-responsive transcriptional repressor